MDGTILFYLFIHFFCLCVTDMLLMLKCLALVSVEKQ